MSLSLAITGSPLSRTVAFLLVSCAFCSAQPKAEVRTPQTLEPREGETLARSLVNEMLTQQPAQNSTNTGMLRIRDSSGDERKVPVRFELFSTPTDCVSIYEAGPGGGQQERVELRVIHSGASPNRYLLGSSSATNGKPVALKELAPAETMIPFAGSDFWLADLGLEFLHWSKQRVVKKEMRRGQFCLQLQSINLNPSASGYVRVESWIDHDPPHGIVHADAYDKNDKLIKVFAPTEIKKVHGEYQLAEMEINNRKTHSRTWIDFDLDQAKH